MRITQMLTSGFKKLEQKAEQRQATKSLEKKAHNDLSKLADLVGGMKEGTEIFHRRGLYGAWKVTSRGLSAGYEHGRAVESRRSAANSFAAGMKNRADLYADSSDSEVRNAALVIRSLLSVRNDGDALKSSGNLAAAIRTLARVSPEEKREARNRQMLSKVQSVAVQKEKATLEAGLSVGPQKKSVDESVHIGPRALEAAKKREIARPVNGPRTRPEESPGTDAVPTAANSNPAPVLEGFGLMLKIARKEVPIPENLPLHQALSLSRLGVDTADIKAKMSPEAQAAFDNVAAKFKNIRPSSQAK